MAAGCAALQLIRCYSKQAVQHCRAPNYSLQKVADCQQSASKKGFKEGGWLKKGHKTPGCATLAFWAPALVSRYVMLLLIRQAVQHWTQSVCGNGDRLCNTGIMGWCAIVSASPLKNPPRIFSGNLVGICVAEATIFAHGWTGIRKWLLDRIRMWCFAVPPC